VDTAVKIEEEEEGFISYSSHRLD